MKFDRRYVFIENCFYLGYSTVIRQIYKRAAMKMMRNKTDATSVVTLIIAIISVYVLFFSTIPTLYKIFIIAFSFILLLLVTFALQSLETMEKPKT
jgi:hypothetical protein